MGLNDMFYRPSTVQHIVSVYFSVASKILHQGQKDAGNKQFQFLSLPDEQFLSCHPQVQRGQGGVVVGSFT